MKRKERRTRFERQDLKLDDLKGIVQRAKAGPLSEADTTAKVLELMAESQEEAAAGEDPDKRTGVFTTGIVSTRGGRRIALFFTGKKHAGENLADLLARRAGELRAPIQYPGAQALTSCCGDGINGPKQRLMNDLHLTMIEAMGLPPPPGNVFGNPAWCKGPLPNLT